MIMDESFGYSFIVSSDVWSLVKVVKREDVIVDEYDLSGSSLTVTLTETLGPQLVVYVEQCSI